MATYEKLRNPPATEALISITVEPAKDIRIDKLEEIHKEIISQYPEKKYRRSWESQFTFKDERVLTSGTEKLSIKGCQFWTADKKQVVQCNLNNFSFNRLKPYKNWGFIFEESKRLFTIYKDKALPVSIKRVDVRYINLIEIPKRKFDLKDYFNESPKIPKGLPQDFNGFFLKLLVPFDSANAKATIVLMAEPSKNPMKTNIVFDINVFSDVSFRPENKDLWETLSQLRNIKNDIFFSTITDKTKELFK